mmetsp:Transcript_75048/g.207010  ORF Transcript_75048/g.207010 Transcript_75048/m.207010 type:complete len:226 (-) Transcript_75048:10-687(-)
MIISKGSRIMLTSRSCACSAGRAPATSHGMPPSDAAPLPRHGSHGLAMSSASSCGDGAKGWPYHVYGPRTVRLSCVCSSSFSFRLNSKPVLWCATSHRSGASTSHRGAASSGAGDAAGGSSPEAPSPTSSPTSAAAASTSAAASSTAPLSDCSASDEVRARASVETASDDETAAASRRQARRAGGRCRSRGHRGGGMVERQGGQRRRPGRRWRPRAAVAHARRIG